MSSVVGYDILPYPGDVGVSQSLAAIPRNSDFGESINAVSNISPGVTVTYSNSTNPIRAEVYPAAPACVNDWDATPADARSLRMAFPGALAPAASISMTYQANVLDSPEDGEIACNSMAVKVTGIGTVTERPRCAAGSQEADLMLDVPERLPLQIGRPGVVPFTVENLGGAASAIATVAIEVPVDITLNNLSPTGWTCTTDPAATFTGPLTLTCDAVDGGGSPRTLAPTPPRSSNSTSHRRPRSPQASCASTVRCPDRPATRTCSTTRHRRACRSSAAPPR